MFEPIPDETEQIVTNLVDAAFKVHRALGPGLLESVYEVCLCHELAKREIPFRRQLNMPVVYDGIRLESGYRLDLLVSEAVIVEIKSVEDITPLHEAQLLTYLKLTGKRIGLLLNFNTPTLKDGFKRLIN